VSIDVTQSPYNADNTGATDCTSAFQAASNAAQAMPTGAEIVFPAGKYMVSGQVNWGQSSGAKAVRHVGEGQQVTQIHMQGQANCWNVGQYATFGDINGDEGTFQMEGMGFYNDVSASSFTATNIAIYLSGVNHGRISDVGVYKGPTAQKVNQAIVMNGCSQVIVDSCDLWSVVNSVTYEGYCQVCTVRDSHLWTSSGSGASNTAALLYKGQTLGCAARHVICHDGDRGVLATQDSNGQTPHLFEFLDVETNNHTIAHFDFQYGVHATLLQCILSGAAVDLNVPGVNFGLNWQGEVTVSASQLIGVPGHGMVIKAGSGYLIEGCKWGGSGSYKAANNTYDELNCASGASQVSVRGNHFNTDTLLGVGTSMVPRWGINSAASSFSQTDNYFASSSLYGTGQHTP